MRVGIIALLHESNTFISEPTTLREFEQDMLLTGEAIRERMAGMKHEVGGFFAALDEAGVTAVPIFAARALPYGTISADAWNALMSALDAALDHTENLDGILVAPHGATVSEEHRDADGSWLRHLRFRVGYDLPIIGTIDPHTNLSPLMVDSTDVLTAYRTNPHIDQLERGQEAARLMIRTLKKEIVPTQAAVYPPMAINIEAQNTSEQPCVALYQLAEEIRQRPGVLSASIVLGFPYADVTEMGSSVIVVTDNQPKLAQQYAAELGEAMWNRREEFAGKMISVHDALDKCAQLPSPVCLLDMGDNVGGGSPADGTILLHALHEKLMGPTVVCLADPAAVKQAEAAGAGNRATLTMGAKTDNLHGEPFTAEVTVVSFNDGKFSDSRTRHGGFTNYDQGRTAVVRTDTDITIVLTTRRMVPFSLHQLTSCDLDPAAFRYLVAKGVQAPLAAYQEVCPSIVRINTPGVTTADVVTLPYEHRRKPLYPWEGDAEWVR
ncbi:MAG: M81 family metallopeptidase [Planctomycetota bacterium]|nr:M81 family metallopeptidase [Planctomycetota bacterium]MDA1213585.1 M81 family metallopeptidase [Planctomycetota bacterium]